MSIIVQLCGLSGSGKSTVSCLVKTKLSEAGYAVELIDGDEYRSKICRDLGFSKEERNENIRRLGFLASRFASHGVVSIIAAINPYDDIRQELMSIYENVVLVYFSCPLEVLIQRDPKGLYKRAMLPEGHAEKLANLTGINDPFEVPKNPDLVIETAIEKPEESAEKMYRFILSEISRMDRPHHSTQSLLQVKTKAASLPDAAL